jgi:polyisoprenoid-binding protein YceI
MRTALRRNISFWILLTLVLTGSLLSATGLSANTSGQPASRVVNTRAIDPRQGAEARYRIDASKSTFMVRAFSGGLLWFKGHDHFIAVRDFTGEVKLTPQSISPASLQMTIKSESLVETRDVFTEPQKQIINKEIQEIVLHTAQYPEITFKSTNVTGKLTSAGQFEAKIEGDLTMHGVTHRIVIPAQVTLGANDLRAKGEFTVDRSDFKVQATSAFHGTVRVRNKLKFSFDILAHSY